MKKENRGGARRGAGRKSLGKVQLSIHVKSATAKKIRRIRPIGTAVDQWAESESPAHSYQLTPDIDAWDKFAATALNGLVASNFYDRAKVQGVKCPIDHMAAAICAEYADAMMVVRNIRIGKL